MNGRQRIEAAFSQEGTPEVGVVIPYEDIYIRDHWAQLTGCPWWYAYSPQIEHQVAWRQEVIPAIGQDWVNLPGCLPRIKRDGRRIEARGEGVFLRNRETGEEVILREPTVGGWNRFGGVYADRFERLAETPEQVDRLVPLREPFDGDRFRAEERDALAKGLLAAWGETLFPTGDATGPLWNCYRLWGFEGMMLMIARRPELVKYACGRFLHNQRVAVREAAALGAVGIWIEDCMTDMISPQAFRMLNLPFLRALVEEIRILGMKSIYYFCGNPEGKLDLLLETGADALSLEESKKGFTIEIIELAEVVRGRCVLLGNLDAIDLLTNGSDEELQREIARQVEAGRKNGRRFVMSLGSPVTPGTSPERVRRYCEVAREMRF